MSEGKSGEEIKKRINKVLLCSWILMVPSLILWAVNVEFALQTVISGWKFLSVVIPESILNLLKPLCADRSSITTLVPVLLWLFPIYHARRLLKQQGDLSNAEPGVLVSDPYPEKFPFFLVMLGLTGTLYGLLIGLWASIGTNSAEIFEAESTVNLPYVIDRLLLGTATAILSSIAGIVGAFLAATLLPEIFRWAEGYEEEELDDSLSETILKLTNDLNGLRMATLGLKSKLGTVEIEKAGQGEQKQSAVKEEEQREREQRAREKEERQREQKEQEHRQEHESAKAEREKEGAVKMEKLEELIKEQRITNEYLDKLVEVLEVNRKSLKTALGAFIGGKEEDEGKQYKV